MATATFNLTVVEKRMLSAVEAAMYSGVPIKLFRTVCPVAPVNLGGRLLYDRRDLDQWLDTEKSGIADTSQAAILERLA